MHQGSVTTYVTVLRELAQHCEYKDMLPDMLRDRLVSGVKHKSITNRLLNEKNLTHEKAMEVAQARESAKDTLTPADSAERARSTPQHYTETEYGPEEQPAAKQGQQSQINVDREDHLPGSISSRVL